LLPFFENWKSTAKAREGFSKKQQNLMLLSIETRDGITRSGNLLIDFCACYNIPHVVSAFLELVDTVFKIPKVSCFLSNRICQDPLEKYFGMQRQAGATNDNPTVLQFTKNNDTLRLVGNMWFDDNQGNCRKSASIKQSIEDTKHLPLRKRKRKRFASF